MVVSLLLFESLDIRLSRKNRVKLNNKLSNHSQITQ